VYCQMRENRLLGLSRSSLNRVVSRAFCSSGFARLGLGWDRRPNISFYRRAGIDAAFGLWFLVMICEVLLLSIEISLLVSYWSDVRGLFFTVTCEVL
jgi:hypothetical protein